MRWVDDRGSTVEGHPGCAADHDVAVLHTRCERPKATLAPMDGWPTFGAMTHAMEPLYRSICSSHRSGDGSVKCRTRTRQGSGVGGWNDFTGGAGAAHEHRSARRQGSRFQTPRLWFLCSPLYLAVLVPLNWGIFRVVGRIELAWIAAPLIAIAGALSVIKLAELDIGFARSQTEISVLEAHNNYPRAHLTRYTALYASLGTTYDLVFDDKNALALPFPADPRISSGCTGRGPTAWSTIEMSSGVRLAGFTVESNSTGMVHSEQMYDLGGVHCLHREERPPRSV